MTSLESTGGPDRRRFLAGAGLTFLTAGCSMLGGSAPKLYALTPEPSLDPQLPRVAWQLSIAVPEAPEALDTERIALMPSATRVDYFADAAWTDRVPRLIQGFLVEAFETSGKIAGVGRDTADLRADYLLQVEIRHFEARYDGGLDHPPQVMVGLESTLVRMPAREIIGNLSTVRQADAARTDLDGVVQGFDAATGDCLARIVAWTLRTPPAG